MNSLRLLSALALALLLSACTGTSAHPNRRLASVSFLNTGPGEYEHLRLSISREHTLTRLDQLHGYSEVFVDVDQLLPNLPRARLEGTYRGNAMRPPPTFVQESSRRDPGEQYNLRITLVADQVFRATLEPVGVAKARLHATERHEEP